jgi:tetratricopeptide (TPR) repeat protein
VNAQLKPAPVALSGTVDDSNPWLGLASFTEETRAYFYGREEEVAELARRVQRKLLTLLFGQSGLGKTSILRAGLVPRLRAQGYCPIYVRIDYGRDAPEPAEQIKQAIRQNARLAGEWTQAGVAVAGESLWEFLHHRDDVLRDESGATLIPLLIFDQFEEIFTLAQGDEFGRARAARFTAELADLVENRPPRALEAKFEDDESAAGRFDFARSDYRVLIALREDYLAPLEGLKKDIPSITQNRLRLAPMTGTQALAAVLQPGGKLVSDEVAAAIVRFVAGGAEIANAEVEPSLLSLICRELNDARIAQSRSEISLDLLAGSHASILSNFYERALADQPMAVRHIIEDDLLTDSGFRENVAEERLLSRFAEAGVPAGTLALLVNRRLLRIEERLDIRRVELTHDVLCGVVKASRDQRHEREAREATERLLAEQHARELAARRAAVRARQIAGACTVLAVAAVGAAVWAYFSGQRAHRAEREAQETRALAEQARGNAENLLGYLSDDFGRELESFGRLDVLAEFSRRQIDYFHHLPPALQGLETTRNGALALIRHARALRNLGNLKVAAADAAEAVQLLTRLRARGDQSAGTTIALALAYQAQSRVLESQNDPAAAATIGKAAALLKPLATAPQASVAARRAYVETLIRLGYVTGTQNRFDEAVQTEKEAMRIAAGLGARDLTDLDMGAFYAEAGAWAVAWLETSGHFADARQIGQDCFQVADGVLERRPGYRLALHAEQVAAGSLTAVGLDELDPGLALREARRDEQVSLTLLNLDPNNIISLNNFAVAESGMGNALWSAGRLRESMPYFLKQLDTAGRAGSGGAIFALSYSGVRGGTAWRQSIGGDLKGAAATVAGGAQFLAKLRASEPAGSVTLRLVEATDLVGKEWFAYESDDLTLARRLAAQTLAETQAVTLQGEAQELQRSSTLHFAFDAQGRAEYQMGDFAAAEHSEQRALEEHKKFAGDATDDRRRHHEVETWIAMAQARQGHTSEAAQTIAPVVKFQRELAARNHGDKWLPFELACALYVEALAEPQHSAALLQEAAGLIDAVPAEVRALREVRQWRERIRAGVSPRA